MSVEAYVCVCVSICACVCVRHLSAYRGSCQRNMPVCTSIYKQTRQGLHTQLADLSLRDYPAGAHHLTTKPTVPTYHTTTTTTTISSLPHDYQECYHCTTLASLPELPPQQSPLLSTRPITTHTTIVRPSLLCQTTTLLPRQPVYSTAYNTC